MVDVLENLNEREFKIDKEKAILLLPINWIGFNYANDKKYGQKLQDDAKLEIDTINKNIISVLIDDTTEMRDECESPLLISFLWMEKWLLWMAIDYS